MKKIVLMTVAVLTMWNTGVFGQVPAYEFSIDTSIYSICMANGYCYPGPNTAFDNLYSHISSVTSFMVCRKKNSTQYDIFSFTGKIGSMTIPVLTDTTFSTSWGDYLFSQTFIDDDPQWECIAHYMGGYYGRPGPLFKVFDSDGAVLLSDSGKAYYGYDGQNTYVFRTMSTNNTPYGYKAWRFRANVSSASPNGLAKAAGGIPHAMMTFGPAGDYRITLAPASGGKTSVRLFDMLGRTLFTKCIDNITSPVTFTIQENGVPPGPFITKVQNEKGISLKREIPLK